MKLRSIIWIPLVLSLAGCGENSTNQTGAVATSRPQKSSAQSQRSEITGMFGLIFGEQLPSNLVRKIDGWRDWAKAGVFSVAPPKPSKIFDDYMVGLLGGLIYKINASRSGTGPALTNIYADAMLELTSQFGPPTSKEALDTRANEGVAWEQTLRQGGRVRMTLTIDKGLASGSGAVVPGHVMLEIQKL